MEESLREGSIDVFWQERNFVAFEADTLGYALEELQSVIAEIEREMKG